MGSQNGSVSSLSRASKIYTWAHLHEPTLNALDNEVHQRDEVREAKPLAPAKARETGQCVSAQLANQVVLGADCSESRPQEVKRACTDQLAEISTHDITHLLKSMTETLEP